MTASAVLEENTITNYEYTKTYAAPNKWQIRRPGKAIFSWVYFDTVEKKANVTYLGKFKSAVDKINVDEENVCADLDKLFAYC